MTRRIDLDLTVPQRLQIERVAQQAVGLRRGLFFVGCAPVTYRRGVVLELYAHATDPELAVHMLRRLMGEMQDESRWCTTEMRF
jgi:hypothetical protein